MKGRCIPLGKSRRKNYIDRIFSVVLTSDGLNSPILRAFTSLESLAKSLVLTGYTTSVEYQGVTYHVQTEDKGRGAAVIVSLVYDGGTVLASKRTNYDEILEGGFDKDTLAKRLRQQHKLICAALMSGRLEDLKKLSARDQERLQSKAKASEYVAPEPKRSPKQSKNISLKIERGIRFKAGDHRDLEVLVADSSTGKPLKGAQVTVKMVGSNFTSLILHARCETSGIALFHLKVPRFSTGRGALVITAVHGEDEVELRRVIRSA